MAVDLDMGKPEEPAFRSKSRTLSSSKKKRTVPLSAKARRVSEFEFKNISG